MAAVTLAGVGKVYPGGVTAVSDVNLAIRDGEFVVLVGPSGCGKSTTLRMIAGLEDISLGTITIGDRVVNDIPPKDRDIAMVFQNYALYPHMTVRENLAFGLKLRGYPKAEIAARLQEAARILQLDALLDRRPKALSGGQRQRVAVGRAIVRKPAVFLFDEPLSNLDAKLRVQMRVEISRLHQQLGTTMVYVTHDQVEAMTMGERIVVMKDGCVQQVASPLELYDRPANQFVAGFIGTPPMNFLAGRLVGDDGPAFVGDEGLRLPLPPVAAGALATQRDLPVTLGLRPEHLLPLSAGAATPAAVLEAHVEVVEHMGAETYLYLRVAGTQVVSRGEARCPARPGERLRLAVLVEHAHLFAADGTRAA